MKNDKLAIVISWWWTNCSYSVWALCAFEEKYNDFKPWIITWTSWWAWIAAYFIAKQNRDTLYIWQNLLSSYKFISMFRFWKVLNVDYLVDEVFKSKVVLNTNKIKNSDIKLVVSATDIESWEVKYFSNKDDILKALKCSKALPVAYNRVVELDWRRYIDWAFSSWLNDDIRKAISLWADKVLVLNVSKLDDNLLIKFWEIILRLFSYFFNKNLKTTVVNFLDSKYEREEHKVPVFYLRPDKLPTNMMDNNKERLLKSISIWYNDVVNNEDLEKFLMNN